MHICRKQKKETEDYYYRLLRKKNLLLLYLDTLTRRIQTIFHYLETSQITVENYLQMLEKGVKTTMFRCLRKLEHLKLITKSERPIERVYSSK